MGGRWKNGETKDEGNCVCLDMRGQVAGRMAVEVETERKLKCVQWPGLLPSCM